VKIHEIPSLNIKNKFIIYLKDEYRMMSSSRINNIKVWSIIQTKNPGIKSKVGYKTNTSKKARGAFSESYNKNKN